MIEKTRGGIAELLSEGQRTRIRQIAYRLRGLSFVLDPYAAEQLRLASEQKTRIEAIVKETWKTIRQAQSATFPGKQAARKSRDAVNAAYRKQYRSILNLLTDTQKNRLTALVGRPFDSSRLGRVSFKAPELPSGGIWINSKPRRLADLRGSVVVLHFWTFG